MAERGAPFVRPCALDVPFAHVRAALDALDVDLPLDALYRDEHIIGRRRNVICIAPHGGGIEPWTRFLAQWAQEEAECDYWSAWAEFRLLLALGLGIAEVDPTCKLLHVTSHRIWQEPLLYPQLHRLLAGRAQPYDFAVAVHGKADDAPDACHMAVGGSSRLRENMRAQLAGHGLDVRLGEGPHAGQHPWNIVNLLGRESVQIEIPRTYRRNPVVGHAIMRAITDTLIAAAD